MNRILLPGVALIGLLTGSLRADLQLSVDGQAPLMIESGIAEIVYTPSARRLAIRTHWDDLRCVLNPDGPQVQLPIPQPGDFVFALDSYDGDVLGEYVIESDGSIAQLLAAIQGGPVLDIVTSASRVANCNGSECATLVCAPGGTPVFESDFEPIVADLGVVWETVPAGTVQQIVGGGAPQTLVLTASNTGQLDATSVFVDVDVLVPGDGSVPCPTVVSGGNGFSFDPNCSGTWTVGDLPADSQVQMELAYSAASNAPLGALAVSDAVIDAPTVSDVNPANNSDSIDLEVVREAELIVNAVSIPASIDLTGGPDTLTISMQVDPARGPSDLNNEIAFALQFPSSGDFTIDISDPAYDPMTRTWTPTVATSLAELTGTLTVSTYEPGMQNFCFGIATATPVDTGVDVFIAADSDPIRCLDVAGPETVALSVVGGAPTTVVAGSGAAGAGNLVQTFTLANDNATIDGENISADLVVVAPSGTTVDSVLPSIGSVSQVSAGTWTWTVPLLLAGQSATLDVVYQVGASTADLAVIDAGLGNVAVQSPQVLANPGVQASASTSVERRIDLVITSGESADPIVAGDTLVYVFQAENVGPSNASNITVDLTTNMPPEASVTSISPNFLGTFANGVWTIPQLSAGNTIDATLTVEIAVGSGAASAPNAISGAAAVSGSAETRINTANDGSSETTSIAASAP